VSDTGPMGLLLYGKKEKNNVTVSFTYITSTFTVCDLISVDSIWLLINMIFVHPIDIAYVVKTTVAFYTSDYL